MPDDVVTMDKIVVALQAARHHLPRLRDLRRDRQHLRLRALRRPAEAQRRRRVVAGDDRRPRRHRRARLGDHPAPAHVGGLGPPRRLHRPARRLPHVQAALPRRPPRRRARRPLPAQAERRSPARARTATSPRRASSTSCSRRRSGRSRRPGSTVYLRPETAQGIFLDFKTVLGFARRKPPFGIAQVGKSFRNEITPGNFIFRTLEFEQMEMEYFVPPDDAAAAGTSTGSRRGWTGTSGLGIRGDHLRLRAHEQDELSHYSSATSDVEYLYPIGWQELEGIANRGDFDLTQHAQHSGEKLEYFDQQSGERYVPHVIEPAAGVGRAMLALLCDAYDEDELGGEARTVLKLHPRMAPVKVAVLPLVRKDGQPELAHEVRNVAAPPDADRVRRGRLDRPPLPPPGRDRHAVVRDDRPPVARGPHGHGARPRHARPGPRRDRRASPTCSPGGSRRPGSRRSWPPSRRRLRRRRLRRGRRRRRGGRRRGRGRRRRRWHRGRGLLLLRGRDGRRRRRSAPACSRPAAWSSSRSRSSAWSSCPSSSSCPSCPWSSRTTCSG